MHRGAFALTSERVGQPPEDLKEALRIQGPCALSGHSVAYVNIIRESLLHISGVSFAAVYPMDDVLSDDLLHHAFG